MRKKLVSVICILTLAVSGLCGCDSKQESTGGTQTGQSKEINVMIWDSTYPDEVFDQFEEETGIHVNVSYITNTDELITKMVSGENEFDYVDVESAYVKTFVENGLLAKIDYDKIPNSENIDDKFWGAVGDEKNEYTMPVSDNIYSLIVYNKETCPIEINSFKDLANSELKDQIVSVTASRTVIGMALASLGYDVNTTEESEIKEATDFLKSMKGNIKVFDGDSPSTELLNGECSVGIVYGGEAAKVMAEMPDDFEVANIEAPILGKNDWFIPAGCAHKEAAEKFINYICDGKVMAQILDVYPYNNFNTAALDYVGEAYKNNKALNLSQEVMDAAKSTTDLGDADVLYDTYWNEFMAQ